MDLSGLQYPKGAKKKRKRVGRGVASGNGKTSGRGHNGYFSRGGAKSRTYFEGGQMPLQRRVPKFGFSNINRVKYQIVNLSQLSHFKEGEEISLEKMKEKNLIKKTTIPVKILGKGILKLKLKVLANRFSKKAIEAIENAGGSVEVL